MWVADPNPRAQAFYRKHGFVLDFRDRDGLGLRYLLGYLTRPSACRALTASRRSIVRIAVTVRGPSSRSDT
jgi:hypothetical protein